MASQGCPRARGSGRPDWEGGGGCRRTVRRGHAATLTSSWVHHAQVVASARRGSGTERGGRHVIPERLRIAQQYLDDAQYFLDADRLASAVSRACYAAYQAMWAALGDPPGPGGRWRHAAIIDHFVRGYWFMPTYPPTGPGLLEPLSGPLRRLYQFRLDADYDLVPISRLHVEECVQTAQRTIIEIAQRAQGAQP
jgi:hypothetical protein